MNYKKYFVLNIDECLANKFYKILLNNKMAFIILETDTNKYVLTKEKSFFKIDDENLFLELFKKDKYYKSIITKNDIKINLNDLNIYKRYIDKYKDDMSKQFYGNKYYFGTVAVKSNNGFITTIRGKNNFDDYTFVKRVNHQKRLVEVAGKKASLNAPLLDYLFKNKKVKVIVHLHKFDANLPYFDYAFPGTARDSIRENKTSFNIKHHGVIYLFDKKGNLL